MAAARKTPFLIDLLWACALLLALIGIPGCSQYAEQPALTDSGSVSVTTWQIVWEADQAAIARVCPPGLAACSTIRIMEARSVCITHAIRPKDFNDIVGLAYLGHEAWHCLGGKHA